MRIAKRMSSSGFTMVELLIVLAIIAILAAVAIPVYSSQMEKSRVEVDNSNLRAATGLAAQDYILRSAGGTGVEYPRNYIVFTYENSTGTGNVKSQNMIVYPANGKVDASGMWIDNRNNGAVNVANPALDIPADSGGNHDLKITSGTGIINGQKVAVLPLQQNGGNARFFILITKGGVVQESNIVANKKVTFNGK